MVWKERENWKEVDFCEGFILICSEKIYIWFWFELLSDLNVNIDRILCINYVIVIILLCYGKNFCIVLVFVMFEEKCCILRMYYFIFYKWVVYFMDLFSCVGWILVVVKWGCNKVNKCYKVLVKW